MKLSGYLTMEMVFTNPQDIVKVKKGYKSNISWVYGHIVYTAVYTNELRSVNSESRWGFHQQGSINIQRSCILNFITLAPGFTTCHIHATGGFRKMDVVIMQFKWKSIL